MVGPKESEEMDRGKERKALKEMRRGNEVLRGRP